jgi:general secretion pathway protein G
MKGSRRSRRPGGRAFTLLEVLMVVVIIGLLAAFVAPNFFGAGDRAKHDLAQATVDSGFANALDVYRAAMGDYPRTDEGGLKLLLEAPQDEKLAKKWAGPYLKVKDLTDPWGHEYIYQYPGKYNDKGYDLSSPGRDGQEGTEDDIVNWQRT